MKSLSYPFLFTSSLAVSAGSDFTKFWIAPVRLELLPFRSWRLTDCRRRRAWSSKRRSPARIEFLRNVVDGAEHDFAGRAAPFFPTVRRERHSPRWLR